MTLRVLLAVTHLLGAGHLVRAAAIGRALASRGHAVTLVSGGVPTTLADTTGLDLVQLPPVRCRVGDFTRLLEGSGQPASQEHLEERRRRLVETFARTRPDVVVTEHFPFGRRSLAPEFQALIDAAAAAAPRPLVLCSIRDILVAPTKPDRAARTHALVLRYYDAVLVHGVEALVPLERSWPLDREAAARVIYTGYVGSDAPSGTVPSLAPADDGVVLVSGGSSAASLPLYRAAIAAARADTARRWRILVGPGVEDGAFDDLLAAASANVRIERTRADFRALMSRAAVFVGQAGYNTVMDVAATRARAILVPFEEGRETEQRLRAESLAERGLADVLAASDLSPARLLEAVGAAAGRRRPVFAMAADGQRVSAEIVERLASDRAAGRSGSAP